MSRHRDPDRVVADWLSDGPTDLPETLRRSIAVAVHAAPQSSAWPKWRIPVLPPNARAVAATVAVVAVTLTAVTLGLGQERPRQPDAPGAATSSAAVSPTTAPTPAPTQAPSHVSPSPEATPGSTASPTAAPTAAATFPSTLPRLSMPGYSVAPAGDYGFTGYLNGRAGMHNAVGSGTTQIVFTLENDCFAQGEGADPVPLTIGGIDALLVEPFLPEIPRRVLYTAMEVAGTAAYELTVADRTLCAFASWDAAATPDEVHAARAVIESVRAEPIGGTGIRVVFTTEGGWDTG